VLNIDGGLAGVSRSIPRSRPEPEPGPMFKPLDPGLHVIVVHGTNTFGHDKTFTYHLTIA
jgi:hypothetical protein